MDKACSDVEQRIEELTKLIAEAKQVLESPSEKASSPAKLSAFIKKHKARKKAKNDLLKYYRQLAELQNQQLEAVKSLAAQLEEIQLSDGSM